MVSIENCLIFLKSINFFFEIFLIIKALPNWKSGLNIGIQAGLDAGHGMTVGVQ